MSTAPAYTYISPGLLTTMRQEMARFLLHKYTRIPRTEPVGELDAWNLQTYTFGIPISGQPCFYEVRAETTIMQSGLTVVNRPRLIVPYTDPLTIGDVVTNVITQDNSLILAGPVIVENIQNQDPNIGGPVLREAFLRAFEFVPSSITTL